MDPPLISFEEGWKIMEIGIRKLSEGVHTCQFDKEVGANLYATCERMCTQKKPHDYSDKLYYKFPETLRTYENELVRQSLKDKQGADFLQQLLKSWRELKIMVRCLKSVFPCVDRYPRANNLPDLDLLGLSSLRRVYKQTRVEAVDAVNSLIKEERDGGNLIEQDLLEKVQDWFVDFESLYIRRQNTQYINDYEKLTLSATSSYYAQKASYWMGEYSCPDYLSKIEEVVEIETKRAPRYLHHSKDSKDMLIQVVLQQLLSSKVCEVLFENEHFGFLENEHFGFLAFLRGDEISLHTRMCNLLSRIPNGLDAVASKFKKQVIAKGMALVNETACATIGRKIKLSVTGRRLLAFFKKVFFLREQCLIYMEQACAPFSIHSSFDYALKEAFMVFCNVDIAGESFEKLLSSFCNNILWKGDSVNPDDVIEDTFNKVIKLLDYISDKDFFGDLYRKKLSHRLMAGTSCIDHERTMFRKLREACGAQFILKMEGMVRDIHVGKANVNVHTGTEMQVAVLNKEFWPPAGAQDLHFPADMAKCMEIFEESYKSKNESKKLQWRKTGTCILTGNFLNGYVKLNLSTQQACLLLLFNSTDKLTYSEIRSQLNLPDDTVKWLLKSLSSEDYKVLIKEPDTPTIFPEDSFVLNDDFDAASESDSESDSDCLEVPFEYDEDMEVE